MILLSAGCGNSFYSAQDYLTGPVDGVGLKKSTSIMSGGVEQLNAVVTPSKTKNKNVTWVSSDTTVVSVDANGVITAIAVVKNGETKNAVITVTTEEGDFSAQCKVTVVEKPVHVTGVTVNKGTSALLTGSTEQLTLEIAPSDATNQNITWASDDSGIASVDQTGLVTGRTPGTTIIKATASDGGIKAECSFTVTNVPVNITGITNNKSSTVILTGKSERLFALLTPLNATNQNVLWTSDNESIATVNSLGTVTAISEGTVTITAKTVDGGFTSSVLCSVVETEVPVSGLSLSKTSIIIPTGYSEKITAEIYPVNATDQNVTWSSSNSKIVSIDSCGKVLGVSSGTTTVTGRTVDGGKTSSCNLIVTDAVVPVTGVTLNKSATSIVEGLSEKLFATVSPVLASNKNITWESGNPLIATVNNTGIVTAVSTGTASITVKTIDGEKTSSCICTITKKPVAVTGLTISPASLSLKKGNTSKITSSITPANATNQIITWSSSKTSVATVDANGIVTATGGGSATVSAVAAGGNNISKTCSVTVTVPVESVRIYITDINTSVAAATITGTTLQLNAAFTPANPSNQTISWESKNASVATVSGTGLVSTGTTSGNATIKVTTTDGGYAAYCIVTVNGYTVTYNANGGTGDTPEDAIYLSGKTVTVQGNTGNLVGPIIQDGICQRFTGWFTLASGGTQAGSTIVIGSSDVTLYAHYTTDAAVIGKIGPSGGFVFYDTGNYIAHGTWRYMEAAPASTEWTNKQWGTRGHILSGIGTDVGTGQTNTTIIKNWLDTNTDNSWGDVANKTDRAAYLCDSLVYGTYDDWFFPSRDELNLMYQNLKCQGIGGFTSDCYWASSQDSPIWTPADMSYTQYFYSPYTSGTTSSKNAGYRVRAARQF